MARINKPLRFLMAATRIGCVNQTTLVVHEWYKSRRAPERAIAEVVSETLRGSRSQPNR